MFLMSFIKSNDEGIKKHILYLPYYTSMAIRYHLYNSKIVKNTYGGVLLLAKFRLLKVTLLQGYFLHFLNCTNGTKSRNTSHIFFWVPFYILRTYFANNPLRSVMCWKKRVGLRITHSWYFLSWVISKISWNFYWFDNLLRSINK